MKSFSQQDVKYMAAALDLARNVKGSTFPNPAVGALVVKNGRIVGKGATAACGGPHAEVAALQMAGPRAAGATLFVTLEPCCHFGRTPPCTDAIIAAGIKRVVAALQDPNPKVAGCGFKKLRRAGIIVEKGLMQQQAYDLNEDFCFAIVNKRPWISLKLAMTLDGRIADTSGKSQWITGEQSREFVHKLRATHAAVGVGAGTLRADDPRLTVRSAKLCGAEPARIVFADPNKIAARSNFIRLAKKIRTICVIGARGKTARKTVKSGMEIWRVGGKNRLAQMRAFMRLAYSEGLTSILIEGGSALASFFLENGLVSRIYFFWGGKIIGSGLPGIQFDKGLSLGKAIELSAIKAACFGQDIMITGIPKRK
ncbi:MAG: bifunctional diaminohydroxyphosphoribosylaminopyrimidine deaminase/5-amino-6-(5-phosphoribosylamino)uracil reductase RibD [Chitinivibrionales bacterium]|nr:bifunctional diaminohydroxyphosphoribosylaminopyrimidine deaminase/5-amino-6-(5-phosphoribosylamino)uracil reductase RibD [Chitinivibrionales bacterium]